MRIAVIGAGNVGGTLGKAFERHGHKVGYGSSRPGANQEVAKDADVVLVATPWTKTKDAVLSAGALTGKIIIDCTNPIKADFTDLEAGRSGAEQIQDWAPGAKVVKCFNQTGFENMAKPEYAGSRAVMFAAGNDEKARQLVADLATEIGFKGVALGPLHLARHLESVAWVWIHGALKAKAFDRGSAFGLLKR